MWQQHVSYLNTWLGLGWQDFVIVILQVGFIVALLPMFRKGAQRPDFFSALMTASFITAFVYVYATMGFYRTVIFTSVLAFEWWALALLGWRRKGI